MAACLAHGSVLALIFNHFLNVSKHNAHFFLHRRLGNYSAFVKISVYAAKQPRISHGTAAYHNRVAIRKLCHFGGRGFINHIAVSDNGNRNRLLNAADNIIIHRAAVHLHAGAP